MTHSEIDRSKVVHEFSVLWPEWECDPLGWVTEDGRAWLTSHGSAPYEANAAALLERMEIALTSASEIRKALALMAEAGKPLPTAESQPGE